MVAPFELRSASQRSFDRAFGALRPFAGGLMRKLPELMSRPSDAEGDWKLRNLRQSHTRGRRHRFAGQALLSQLESSDDPS